MKRKLIQMANKTMVISLPIDTVRKYGLKKGQELEVEENNGRISIFIKNQLYKEQCKLRAKEPIIQEQLESLYAQGYDEIKVFYEDKSVLKKIIQNINKKFISFQVLESNSKYCIIKSIVKEDATKLPNLIRRLFLILLSLLENDDEDSKENLIKLIYICKRMLHQKSYDFNEAMVFYKLITIIEEISQLEYKNKRSAKELIEQIYNLYYKFDELESIQTKDKIRKELTTAKKDSNKTLFLYNALKMIDLTIMKNFYVEF